MNLENLDLISQLENFKKFVNDWYSTNDVPHKDELRSLINQNLPTIKSIVIGAGCNKLITITPPPAFGGLILRDADPFDMIFGGPYGMKMVSVISDMIDQTIGTLNINPELEKKLRATDITTKDYYVDPTRIRQIADIPSEEFDTTKLVKMCEELNIANINNCYMTVAMLVRAIIDHVPPILRCSTFKEVANNYKGTKSFSESMKHLDESMRKISDSILHTEIRKKEVLPTFVQVNFSADLDVLLGEIIRVYKK